MRHIIDGSPSRRGWLRLAPWAFSFSRGLAAPPPTQPGPVPDTFPTQPPALAMDMVTVAHGNMKRVRELVEARPSLAKASWDWGFGDWETALGAASHTGQREIASYLLAHGAPPTLFSAAMLGQLEVVRAFITAQPGAQRVEGPHSISLLAHAKAGGQAALAVRDYLESLGDAGAAPPIPLSPEDVAALPGVYLFGPGPADSIEITAARGQLTFTRQGTMGRGLIHLGERAFSPAGASAVRIRFAGAGQNLTLTVHDPGLMLSAARAR